ncbi:DNA translocase FtsK [Agrobacterium sp. a22-2]|uniref:DNA translocase FtsK n=1 Tax=Agrobacterium sp. a22-2 TaxID=2283840 RepID=UPI0014474FD6|nr:DNA translocase FtsK [Agrobacterium sp. a22-2]NKN36833.1 DNA translocase FtsK [Agrobacterium sp. a22-2]
MDRQPSTQTFPDAVILDPAKLPAWQRAFVLGPNVRFTRTPSAAGVRPEAERRDVVTAAVSPPHPSGQTVADPLPSSAYVIGRGNPAFPSRTETTPSPAGELQRQISQALQAQESGQAASIETQTALPQGVPPIRTGSPLIVPKRLAPQQRGSGFVQTVLDHGTQAATEPAPATGLQQGEPSANLPAPAAEPQPQAAAAQAPGGPVLPKPSVTPARFVSTIPDHLIWEMMSLGASDGAETRAAPQAPTRQAAAFVQRPVAGANPMAAGTPADAVPRLNPKPVQVPSVPAKATSESRDPLPSAVHLYRQVALHRPAALQVEAAEPVVTLDTALQPAAAAVQPAIATEAPSTRLTAKRAPGPLSFVQTEDYLFPDVDLLQTAAPRQVGMMSQEALEQSAGLLESILEDFGVKGEIIDVRPGPVVTLYEFEPAPGVKSSRIINLSDDIARSMSALSARVAVVPGRNVIGIELPNAERETVYLRELIESGSYVGTDHRLPLCLGKTIGGEPVIADLARMPHLLVAGTTGSGKSVAINTMILSLIYHLRPEECRLIMVDPKMLELSVYDGIPHLLTPVVTDAKKAVLALKWAVREMEERYRKMSRLGVRNIDGFNARVAQARSTGETIMLSVPSGFDRATGEQTFEDQELDLTALPFIVVIVDEMADLMMVAGKEIEGAIQRLAQMARAAGIHLIMATQRPSVDVITGTIKANFPTRISFQVTSKIDSRTILGEQGAEHLLGQGDMLHMVGGGRIARVHGPFVSDREVENVVKHLKTQGQPAYLGSVTEDDDEVAAEEDTPVFDDTAMGGESDGDELYERAIKIVQRDKKCSTSYIQRRLSIGYNRAASLVERMEKDGLVGAPNHVGKREILAQRTMDVKDGEHQMG